MNGNYFEDLKNQTGKNKVLLLIIGALLIINLTLFKGFIDIASNKTVTFQVPTFLESGDYVIGSTFANENVFKMWSKVWITELANFSYKDVRERTTHIMDFLAPSTAYKNKGQMLKYIDFVEQNFVTQTFSPKDFYIEELAKKGYYSIQWSGMLKRSIGMKQDNLSNLDYTYEFICFVRNGQVYIHSLKTFLSNEKDIKVRNRLQENEFVNFEVYESKKAQEKKVAKEKKAEKIKEARRKQNQSRGE